MSTTIQSKPCQGNNNGIKCEKDARAKCFHCSLDLCLIHLTEHTEYVENESRSFLYPYEKIFNEFLNKFQTLSISSRITEEPFVQLEKWRHDAHKKLDQLVEEKRQEIQEKISEYQIEFSKKTQEQKQKLEILIKHLHKLSKQTQISNKDMKYLEEKIVQTKNFFCLIDKHSIKLSTDSFSVHIRTNFFDSKSIPSASPTPSQTRKTRPEIKETKDRRSKQQFDKKRSLSVSLL